MTRISILVLVVGGLAACDKNEPAPAAPPAPAKTEQAAAVKAEDTPAKVAPATNSAAVPGQPGAQIPGVKIPPLMELSPEFGGEEDDATGDRVLLFLHKDFYARCGPGQIPPPNFPLDSAKPKYEEAEELRNLARCLTTAPFDQAKITLVGRTDPRGTRTYNKALGAKRAATIERVLTTHGVTSDRITTISAGEPAPGVEVRSWEDARRVDVLLTMDPTE